MPKMPTPLKWTLWITGGLFLLHFLPYIIAFGSVVLPVLGTFALIALVIGFVIAWVTQ